jgi:hypothetical protein
VGAGVKAGVPDVLVFSRVPSRPEARGVAIELKSERGRTSKDQDRWLAALRDDGWVALVEYGFEGAMHALGLCGWDVDGALSRCRVRGEWWDGSRWSRPADRVRAARAAKVGG